MDKTQTFSSVEEECCHWQEQARKYYQEYLDVQQELEDFTEGSRQLEAELETSLEQREKTIKDLKMALNQLQNDNESLRKRLGNYDSDYSKLEQKYSVVCEEKDRLKSYTRELEQINDDLERAHRIVTESVTGFELMLNQAYEKNALLEIEVDEKEMLQVKLQRLMDETRDLKQELNVKTIPSDNRTANIDKTLTSDEICHIESETQTIGGAEATTNVPHPIKHSENVLNGNAMTASSRLSALNLVAELLRKVNLEKLLCSGCDKFRCICSNRPSVVSRPITDTHPHPHTVNATSPATVLPPASTLFKRLSQKISAVSSIPLQTPPSLSSPSTTNPSPLLSNSTLSVSHSCISSSTTSNETSAAKLPPRWPQRINSSDIDDETIIYSNCLRTDQ